ncbi:hypothetical protein QBC38DRAFT_528192, partial [Podospora fimiseda]
MCGIHASISTTPHVISDDLHRCLSNRGPDHFGQVERRVGKRIVKLTSTVLALRGGHVTPQPLQIEDVSVLCWNGEAWRVDGEFVEGNDGEFLFKKMIGEGRTPLDVLRGVEGPFAFVYFDAEENRIYYGRDRLGRRSLMMRRDEGTGEMVFCSVAEDGGEWKEVEADGIYAVGFGEGEELERMKYEWVDEEGSEDFVSIMSPFSFTVVVSSIGRFNKALPEGKTELTAASPSVFMLKQQLVESLKLRVLNIPQPPNVEAQSKTRVAVLFSGGLDCTVLARLCHDILPPDQGIDLLNVGFENPRVVAQLKKDSNGEVGDFYEACPDRMTGRKSFAELQKVCPGRAFRFVAVNVPYAEMQAHRRQVISLLIPHNTEMDLSIGCALYFAARGQGLCTEASCVDSAPVPYTSPARVLLSGLGADELFGGYSRHPSAFHRQGYAGLVDELLVDVSRLGKRNLGRDDRVMAHWSKEVRFPYLDERLVRWAIETPAWEKCDFENSDEVSGVEAGKRVLRLVALELGMDGVAKEKKRAIQFGARTAKMESGKVKGTTLIS